MPLQQLPKANPRTCHRKANLGETAMLKRWIWVITFLGIICGAGVDIMKTIVEILEDKEKEKEIL